MCSWVEHSSILSESLPLVQAGLSVFLKGNIALSNFFCVQLRMPSPKANGVQPITFPYYWVPVVAHLTLTGTVAHRLRSMASTRIAKEVPCESR